jgi:O-antigen/teichoic acid export membrane protein
VLALAIPTVTVASGLRGILEALQRFRVLSLIRIPMSMFSFLGTLLVLPFSRSLVAVIAVLTVGRAVGVVVHLLVCFRALPALRRHFEVSPSALVPALRFGGWMTVSNIVGPIMVYVDRFVIGALLSVSVLAYYTAPFDMITRLLFIPGAVAAVLFPAFAVSLRRDPDRVGVLLGRGVKYMVLVIFPIVLIVTALAPEGLRFWLGPAFAQNGTVVLRWLAVGVFVNCLAQVPFALIQSSGRPDITAKLHLAEFPLYLASVWLLTSRVGLEGTAIAWTLRATVDAILICVFAGRVLPRKSRFLARAMTVITTGSLALYLVTLPGSIAVRAGLAALGVVGFASLGWFWFLTPDERNHAFMVLENDAARARDLEDAPTHFS